MWDFHYWIATGELMNSFGGLANSVFLAALADADYTVDMSTATPWPVTAGDAGGGSAGDFNDRVIEVLPVPFIRAPRSRGR